MLLPLKLSVAHTSDADVHLFFLIHLLMRRTITGALALNTCELNHLTDEKKRAPTGCLHFSHLAALEMSLLIPKIVFSICQHGKTGVLQFLYQVEQQPLTDLIYPESGTLRGTFSSNCGETTA